MWKLGSTSLVEHFFVAVYDFCLFFILSVLRGTRLLGLPHFQLKPILFLASLLETILRQKIGKKSDVSLLEQWRVVPILLTWARSFTVVKKNEGQPASNTAGRDD